MLTLVFATLLFGAQATVHFVNRTEVPLVLEVDGTEFCTAQSFGECEAVVPYGPHHLAANFNGKNVITREAPPKAQVVFSVCHVSDTNNVCHNKEN